MGDDGDAKIDLGAATADLFEPVVGQELTISDGTRSMPLLLESIKRLKPVPDDAIGRETLRPSPFSLSLRGPAEPVVPPGVYRVHFSAIGMADLYLSPFHADADGAFYEILFN